MKLPFQKYIENSNFSSNISVLFEEAITCYKVGAYRASLLLSYLAFLTVLKERVLSAQKPNEFPDGQWKKMLKDLQNEDKWEASVFDATQLTETYDNNKIRTKDPVFSISENIRHQIKYWKDRRNDCAHNKDSLISNSHVEAFWAFIESNDKKITIEGGMLSFLAKIKKHYDTTYTPTGKDISPLIEELKYSVPKEKLMDLWDKIFENIDSDFANYEIINDKILDFIDKIIIVYHNDDNIKNSLVSYLKRKDYIYKLLDYNPKYFPLLGYNEDEIRNFWHIKIEKINDICAMYAFMLRNNLIPDNDIQEANKIIFNKLRKYKPNLEDASILVKNGFDKVMYDTIFGGSNLADFDWANRKASVILGYIENFEMDSVIVDKICKEFNRDSYYSYDLQNILNKLFTNNETKKLEFIQIANSNNFTLPKQIKAFGKI